MSTIDGAPSFHIKLNSGSTTSGQFTVQDDNGGSPINRFRITETGEVMLSAPAASDDMKLLADKLTLRSRLSSGTAVEFDFNGGADVTWEYDPGQVKVTTSSSDAYRVDCEVMKIEVPSPVGAVDRELLRFISAGVLQGVIRAPKGFTVSRETLELCASPTLGLNAANGRVRIRNHTPTADDILVLALGAGDRLTLDCDPTAGWMRMYPTGTDLILRTALGGDRRVWVALEKSGHAFGIRDSGGGLTYRADEAGTHTWFTGGNELLLLNFTPDSATLTVGDVGVNRRGVVQAVSPTAALRGCLQLQDESGTDHYFFVDDDGRLRFGSSLPGSGDGNPVGNTLARVEDVGGSSPYSIGTGDLGKVLTNGIATGALTINLPAASIGTTYTFLRVVAENLKVQCASGDTIQVGDDVSGGAGYAECTESTKGQVLGVVGTSGSSWVALNSSGTWTTV